MLESMLLPGRPYAAAWARGPSARPGVSEWTYEHAKRLLDIVLAVLLLPLALPLLCVCALAVRLESPGPAFVRQRHTGRGGRWFDAIRLRTVSPAEGWRGQFTPRAAPGSQEFEVVDDPRVTRVGRALRASGLDGLPQLLNVLRGEMSFVGPRPTQLAVGTGRLWHTALLEARPGLTGLSQLREYDDDLTPDELLRLDVAYVRRRALGLDVRILLRAAVVTVGMLRYLVKRAFDITVAGALVVLLSPVLVALAVAVHRSSPGPVLFRQVRVGKNGYRFRVLKFRTMRVDAEAVLAADPVLHAAYVMNDFKLPLATDPRITPLGRWLRRTSLDELPQLFNVLRGEMSLVGPRPVVPDEIVHYGRRAARFLSAVPGVTGAWQVCGRSDLHYPERCDVELRYVRTWSLSQDVVILFRTVRVVVSGRGAT